MEGKIGKNTGEGTKRDKPNLKVVSVRFTPVPGNDYRFKKLFDLILRPYQGKEGDENGYSRSNRQV